MPLKEWRKYLILLWISYTESAKVIQINHLFSLKYVDHILDLSSKLFQVHQVTNMEKRCIISQKQSGLPNLMMCRFYLDYR